MNHYVKRAATLLDVSRLTADSSNLSPAPAIFATSYKASSGHTPRLPTTRCTIGIDAPASLPETFDRLAVEQVLDNLVSKCPSNMVLVSRCTSAKP